MLNAAPLTTDAPAATTSAEAPPLPHLGSCHGFAVRSDLPLRLLRAGINGQEALAVRRVETVDDEPRSEPLREWRPGPGRPFSARLHQLGSLLAYYADDIATFRIDPVDRWIEVSPKTAAPRWEARLWGIPSVVCFLAGGDLSLHAAAVEVDGRALLIPAPSRHGKTTLAAAFQQAGHRLLAEDLCRCRPGPEPTVYPGPAMLRVRHDAAANMGPVAEAAVRHRDDDRVHIELAGSRRGDGAPVPLGGVVLLSVTEGGPRLERVHPVEAVPSLWPMSFHLPTDAGRARCFEGLAQLAATVPIWRLSRQLRFAELPAVLDLLVERLGESR